MGSVVRMKFGQLCCLLLILKLTVVDSLDTGHNEDSYNPVICTVCEAVMKALDETLVEPSNEQAVADFLGQVCKYLGGQLETICIEFVGEYTDDIIDMLVAQYLNPDQVCTALSACP